MTSNHTQLIIALAIALNHITELRGVLVDVRSDLAANFDAGFPADMQDVYEQLLEMIGQLLKLFEHEIETTAINFAAHRARS